LANAAFTDDGEPHQPDRRSLLAHVWDSVGASAHIHEADAVDDSATVAPEASIARLECEGHVENLPRNDSFADYRGMRNIAGDNSIDIAWRPSIEHVVGTIFHEEMERLVLRRFAVSGESYAATRTVFWRTRAAGLGAPVFLHQQIANDVGTLVNKALSDKSFLDWITAGKNRTEFAITVHRHPKCDTAVLDLVRYDDDGTVSILDYKTTAPSGGESIDNFLVRQAHAHSEQLQRYVDAFRKAENTAKIEAFLYFPAIQRLHKLESIR
jgi:hypothetical protein